MPTVTKLLFMLVGWGLAMFVVVSFMHGARRPSRNRPVTRTRERHLWIVDPAPGSDEAYEDWRIR